MKPVRQLIATTIHVTSMMDNIILIKKEYNGSTGLTVISVHVIFH